MTRHCNRIPRPRPGLSEFRLRLNRHDRPMNMITLESCHSTWIFDARQLRFCRILKGIAVGQRWISTEWRPYWELEIDPREKSFTIFLNEARADAKPGLLNALACGATDYIEKPIDPATFVDQIRKHLPVEA